MPKPDSHIFIVGGTAGLGLAIARSAASLGCHVTIAGRGQERAAEIAKSLSPSANGVHIDLEDPASIQAAFAKGEPIDHLVITAVHEFATSIKELDIEESAKLVYIKLIGYAASVKQSLPRLRPDSSIVLFGGLAKANPYPGSTMVSTVNGGIVGLTKTMAVELGPIRVNGISPSLVPDSPLGKRRIAAGASSVVDAIKARTPSRRLTSTEDVVHATFFLLDNRGVNGIDLEIDGGIQLV
jgi:NAD(P)-dependent dehydrogenase (short-subunit alcohol dehydrogenase family)